VPQPLSPATTSLIRPRRSERGLTASAQGVSGAAPLPAFLTPYKTGAGDPESICLPRERRRRETRKRSVEPEDSHSACRSGSKDSGRSRWLYWTRVKSPSLPNFNGSLTIHFTRTQKLFIRVLKAQHVAEKIELHAAEDVDEAGATPPFAARCVTGSVGSLPPRHAESVIGFGRVRGKKQAVGTAVIGDPK